MRVAGKQLCQKTLSSETPPSRVCRTQSLEAIAHGNISEPERHREGKTPNVLPFFVRPSVRQEMKQEPAQGRAQETVSVTQDSEESTYMRVKGAPGLTLHTAGLSRSGDQP